jgi:transposase-like protein
MSALSKPYFHDEPLAFAELERLLWPEGPVCPHCGSISGRHYDLRKTRVGLRKCSDCRKQFTVKVGTVFESAHIPLNKMLQAVYLMCSSKKGVSAHQLHRILEITYKSAWFLAHRIREAMGTREILALGVLGGKNEAVEVDETYVGGKAKNRAYRTPAPKKAVVSLIERDGRVASFHVANVTATTLKPIIIQHVHAGSSLMTDEAPVYKGIGKSFSAHHSVNHSADEYVRLGGFVHTNTAENFFSVLKRGISGVYQHVSVAHLDRYLAEFDFRHNNRSKLGVDDVQRTDRALQGIKGKRLKYKGSSATLGA